METDCTPLPESPKHYGRQGIALETYLFTLNHLVKLASTNGWKAHAWYRAKELETHPFSEASINEWLESTRMVSGTGTGTAPIGDIQGNQSGIDSNNESKK